MTVPEMWGEIIGINPKTARLPSFLATQAEGPWRHLVYFGGFICWFVSKNSVGHQGPDEHIVLFSWVEVSFLCLVR